jgi:hypothetical protein
MVEALRAFKSGAVAGWSMGFDKFKTTTPAALWERKAAVRGLIAAVIVAFVLAGYYVAVWALGLPTVLAALATGPICLIAGIYFYQWLNRDIEEESN